MGYAGAGTGILLIVYIIFMLGMAALSVYCLVLFIKLANRGILALDNYNNKSLRELKNNQEDTSEYN